MLPLMLSAVKIIRATKPVKVVVACAESIDPDVLRRIAGESGEEISIAQGRSWEVMNASDFIICKSGTSTLQAAIAGTPMVIVYKSDYLSYFLARTMTHVRWAGLPNLLAGRQVVPELIQGKMTPGNIASATLPYLMDVSKLSFGPRMRRAGVDTLYDIAQMSSVGVASMLGRIRFFLKVLNEFRARISDGEYEAVIIIDYPDFNLRIAKSADSAGTPVFYYVCPQLWAWRRYRLRAVRSCVDMMMVVFPTCR